MNMKIVMTAVDNHNTPTIFGPGEDGKVYIWDATWGDWRLHHIA